MASNPLLGTWKLHSFKIVDAGGIAFDALGRDPIGYLIYTRDGHVAVQMMSANRKSIARKDLRDIRVRDKARLVDTYRSYAGTYRIEKNKVLHKVKVGLVPNWLEMKLLRTFEKKGKILTLTGPTTVHGKHQVAVLVWEKI